jgi:hypothetical protein
MTLISNTNYQFEDYVRSSRGDLEIVPWCLYSTRILRDGARDRLAFFERRDDELQSVCRTNLYMQCVLPAPMAMEIQEIKIFGVASDIALASFRLQIGNKIMVERPLWTTCLRDRFLCRPPFLIAPLQMFRASIEWEDAIRLGSGLSGRYIEARPIQVALLGRVARSVA